MTTPADPYGKAGQNPPPPPGYGPPPSAGTPQDGQASYGQASYGQASYGQAPYGGAPAATYGGTLASWGLRVVAVLLDGIIVGVPALILAVIFVVAKVAILAILVYLAAVGFAFWNLARQGSKGQTLGKQFVGIWLIREADGQFVGAGMGIVRNFIHIIDGIPCYLGYLWPLWDAKNQTFTDKVMGTVVVKR